MARNVDGTVITEMSPSHRSSLSPAPCAAARSPTDTAAIRRPFGTFAMTLTLNEVHDRPCTTSLSILRQVIVLSGAGQITTR
jgi:hypothetical protein